MRILHLCNDYFYSTIYRNLHQNLLSENIDSHMIVPSDNNATDKPQEKNVYQVKCFNKIEKLFYFIKQRKILNRFKKMVTKRKPDVLHAHFIFSSGYACMKIKKELNIPYIVAVRNTDVKPPVALPISAVLAALVMYWMKYQPASLFLALLGMPRPHSQ